MTFDAALALTTALLSQIAYRPVDQAERNLEELGFTNHRHFSGTSTQAFLTEDDTNRYLSFRGTESTNHVDWMRDAQFKPVTGVFGTKVHSGFRRALDEVWEEIVPLADDKRLVITGHSLGAGLAALAAARIVAAGGTVGDVYTYGSPRAGLKDFVTTYNAALGSNTYRVINHIDIVTRVPLLVQDYRHVGRRMYFDGNKTFYPDAGAWHIAKDDLLARLKHFGTIKSAGITPHEIGRYLDRIRSIQ
ncbi:MAG: lipase family protein [bacterium]|nr:lipase family protein [bacterium]